MFSSAIDLRQGQIYPGEPKQPLKAECTLTISDEDLGAMAAGKLFLRKVRVMLGNDNYCCHNVYIYIYIYIYSVI